MPNQLGHQLILINFYHWSQISTLLRSHPAISNSKIIIESSFIAYSVKNFTRKNIKLDIFDKIDMWGDMTSHQYMTSYNSAMTPYLSTCLLNKKCPVVMFFSIKFPIKWTTIKEFSTKTLKIDFPMGGRSQNGPVPLAHSRNWTKWRLYSWSGIKID